MTNVEVGGYSQYTPRFVLLRYSRKSSKTFPSISIFDNKRSSIFHKRLHQQRNGNEFQKVGLIVNQRIPVTVADRQAMYRKYIHLCLPIVVYHQLIAMYRQPTLKYIPSHQQTNPFLVGFQERIRIG